MACGLPDLAMRVSVERHSSSSHGGVKVPVKAPCSMNAKMMPKYIACCLQQANP